MRKPKHGDIWVIGDGRKELIIEHDGISLRGTLFEDLFQRLLANKEIDGWFATCDYNDNGEYRDQNSASALSYKLKTFVRNVFSESNTTGPVATPSCKHTWKQSHNHPSKDWCCICGEYKDK